MRSAVIDTGIVYLDQNTGVGECEYKGLTQGSLPAGETSLMMTSQLSQCKISH